MVENYRFRVIKSGGVTEIYAYSADREKIIKSEEQIEEETIAKLKAKMNPKTGEIKEPKKLKVEVEAEKEKAKNYKRLPASVQRTRSNIRRLIDANVAQYDEMEKFLTLTFDRDVSREEAMTEFKQFVQRLKYYYGSKFKYIGVIELQKSGRIHFHVILFGLPYIRQKELDKIWDNGRVDIRAVTDYKDLSGYVVKYIQKTLSSSNFIPKHKKFYICSRGLIKPEELLIEDEYELVEMLEDAGRQVCSVEFHSEFVGDVRYSKFQQTKSITWEDLD